MIGNHIIELLRYDAQAIWTGGSPCAFWTGEACRKICAIQIQMKRWIRSHLPFFEHKGCYASLEVSGIVPGLVDTWSSIANKCHDFSTASTRQSSLYVATMIRIISASTLFMTPSPSYNNPLRAIIFRVLFKTKLQSQLSKSSAWPAF